MKISKSSHHRQSKEMVRFLFASFLFYSTISLLPWELRATGVNKKVAVEMPGNPVTTETKQASSERLGILEDFIPEDIEIHKISRGLITRISGKASWGGGSKSIVIEIFENIIYPDTTGKVRLIKATFKNYTVGLPVNKVLMDRVQGIDLGICQRESISLLRYSLMLYYLNHSSDPKIATYKKAIEKLNDQTCS